jgi:hypothetical protein
VTRKLNLRSLELPLPKLPLLHCPAHQMMILNKKIRHRKVLMMRHWKKKKVKSQSRRRAHLRKTHMSGLLIAQYAKEDHDSDSNFRRN